MSYDRQMYFENIKNIKYLTKQEVNTFNLPRIGKELHLAKRRKAFFSIFDKPKRIPYSMFVNDEFMEEFALDLNDLIISFPSFTVLRFNLSPHTTRLYPLLEMGLKINLGYTQLIDLSVGLDQLWKNLDAKRRSEIKLTSNSLRIIESDDLKILQQLHLDTLGGKGLLATADDTWSHINQNIVSNSDCKLLYAMDEHGEILSGGLFTYDKKNAYYLLGGTNNKGKRLSASSFLLWNAIELFTHMGVSTFDFEGSENASVSKFFEQFGSTSTPYWKCEARKILSYAR